MHIKGRCDVLQSQRREDTAASVENAIAIREGVVRRASLKSSLVGSVSLEGESRPPQGVGAFAPLYDRATVKTKPKTKPNIAIWIRRRTV